MRPMLACLLVLSACTVGPDFTPPKAPEVARWNDPAARSAAISTQTNPNPKWWDGFNDPILTQVIEKAAKGQPDLPAGRGPRRRSRTGRSQRPRRRVTHRQRQW